MNLQEMIRRVEQLTRHQANIAERRSSIAAELNDSHRYICTLYPWTFMHRTAPLWTRPDLVAKAVTGEESPPESKLTFITSDIESSVWTARNTDALRDDYELLRQLLLDGEVTLETRDVTTVGDQYWHLAPFYIENVDVTVEGTAGPSTVEFTVWLDPRFTPSAGTSEIANIQVRWRRYQLPVDCDKPLSVVTEDGPIPVVSHTEGRRYMTEYGRSSVGIDIEDQTGPRPAVMVYHPNPTQRLPQPGALLGTGGNPNAPTYATRIRAEQLHPPPVHGTITATSNASGTGALVVGQAYRVFVSWFVSGRFGPPSETDTVTISDEHDAIQLANLPTYEAGRAANGRRLSVWIAKGTAESAFYLAGFVLDEQDSTIVFGYHPAEQPAKPADTVEFAYANWLLRWDEEYRPRYGYLRPWPRPANLERMELHYLVRPRELIELRDEPDPTWAPFHDAIVHHTVARLAMMYGARSMHRTQQALFEQRIRHLKARYLPPGPSRPQGLHADWDWHPFPNGVDWQG